MPPIKRSLKNVKKVQRERSSQDAEHTKERLSSVLNATAICDRMSHIRSVGAKEGTSIIDLLSNHSIEELTLEPPSDVCTAFHLSYDACLRKVYWKPPKKPQDIDGYKVMMSDDSETWMLMKVCNNKTHQSSGFPLGKKIGVCTFKGNKESEIVISKPLTYKTQPEDILEMYKSDSYMLADSGIPSYDIRRSDVQMMPLKLYRVLHTPINLTALDNKGSVKDINSSSPVHKNVKFCFCLDADLVSRILKSKDTTSNTYGIQVLLRFCLNDQHSIQDDVLPDCIIKVNNKFVLQEKPDVKNGPLDITHLCYFTEGMDSQTFLSIEWMPNVLKRYCVTVCVAEKLSSPENVTDLMEFNLNDQSTSKEIDRNIPDGAIYLGKSESVEGDVKHTYSYFALHTEERTTASAANVNSQEPCKVIKPADGKCVMPLTKKNVEENKQINKRLLKAKQMEDWTLKPPADVLTILYLSKHGYFYKVYWKPPKASLPIDGYKVMTSEDGITWVSHTVCDNRTHHFIGLPLGKKVGVCSFRGIEESEIVFNKPLRAKAAPRDNGEGYRSKSYIITNIILSNTIEKSNVKMMPFKFHNVLCTPISLTTLDGKYCTNYEKSSTTTKKCIKFCFCLEADLVDRIVKSKDSTSNRYDIQVFLRFCIDDESCVQDDVMPYCIVKVNNKIALMQVKDQRSEPVDITHLCNLVEGMDSEDVLSIEWMPSSKKGYCVTVCVAEKLSIPGIVSSLMENSVKDQSTTREMVKNKFESDIDVHCTSLKVSLICPLGKTRLVSPCRGSNCTHVQCMDALTLLRMNDDRPTSNKKCYMCDKVLDDIYIDGLFLEILSVVPQGITEVEFRQDGSWVFENAEYFGPSGKTSVAPNTEAINEEMEKTQSKEVTGDSKTAVDNETESDILNEMNTNLLRLASHIDQLHKLSNGQEISQDISLDDGIDQPVTSSSSHKRNKQHQVGANIDRRKTTQDDEVNSSSDIDPGTTRVSVEEENSRIRDKGEVTEIIDVDEIQFEKEQEDNKDSIERFSKEKESTVETETRIENMIALMLKKVKNSRMIMESEEKNRDVDVVSINDNYQNKFKVVYKNSNKANATKPKQGVENNVVSVRIDRKGAKNNVVSVRIEPNNHKKHSVEIDLGVESGAYSSLYKADGTLVSDDSDPICRISNCGNQVLQGASLSGQEFGHSESNEKCKKDRVDVDGLKIDDKVDNNIENDKVESVNKTKSRSCSAKIIRNNNIGTNIANKTTERSRFRRIVKGKMPFEHQVLQGASLSCQEFDGHNKSNEKLKKDSVKELETDDKIDSNIEIDKVKSEKRMHTRSRSAKIKDHGNMATNVDNNNTETSNVDNGNTETSNVDKNYTETSRVRRTIKRKMPFEHHVLQGASLLGQDFKHSMSKEKCKKDSVNGLEIDDKVDCHNENVEVKSEKRMRTRSCKAKIKHRGNLATKIANNVERSRGRRIMRRKMPFERQVLQSASLSGQEFGHSRLNEKCKKNGVDGPQIDDKVDNNIEIDKVKSKNKMQTRSCSAKIKHHGNLATKIANKITERSRVRRTMKRKIPFEHRVLQGDSLSDKDCGHSESNGKCKKNSVKGLEIDDNVDSHNENVKFKSENRIQTRFRSAKIKHNRIQATSRSAKIKNNRMQTIFCSAKIKYHDNLGTNIDNSNTETSRIKRTIKRKVPFEHQENHKKNISDLRSGDCLSNCEKSNLKKNFKRSTTHARFRKCQEKSVEILKQTKERVMKKYNTRSAVCNSRSAVKDISRTVKSEALNKRPRPVKEITCTRTTTKPSISKKSCDKESVSSNGELKGDRTEKHTSLLNKHSDKTMSPTSFKRVSMEAGKGKSTEIPGIVVRKKKVKSKKLLVDSIKELSDIHILQQMVIDDSEMMKKKTIMGSPPSTKFLLKIAESGMTRKLQKSSPGPCIQDVLRRPSKTFMSKRLQKYCEGLLIGNDKAANLDKSQGTSTSQKSDDEESNNTNNAVVKEEALN